MADSVEAKTAVQDLAGWFAVLSDRQKVVTIATASTHSPLNLTGLKRR